MNSQRLFFEIIHAQPIDDDHINPLMKRLIISHFRLFLLQTTTDTIKVQFELKDVGVNEHAAT